MIVREYVDDYIKYYPERWRWELKKSNDQAELYMSTRARRCKEVNKNNDLLPDFYSIERDAAQFELSHIEWTDFLGLTWIGKKGLHAYVGAPDYKGSLYYYCSDEDYEESGYCISETYDAYKHHPPIDIYTKISERGTNRWIDTTNVVDIRYRYIINNHLFKDTSIDLVYREGDELTVYSDYQNLINGLLEHGKEELVRSLFKTMNEHFIKLRESEREEVRAFYPGKTAEEMFLREPLY